jgi:hypothetical protein
MQVSGSFPQLSDNSKKQIRKQASTRSAAGMQKGGAVGGSKRLHTGTTAGNRARARQRAGREE